MRKVFSLLSLIFTTLFLGLTGLFVSLFTKKEDTIHRIARLWAKLLLKSGGISVKVEDMGNIGNPPYVFMANHQSALDILILLAALPLSFKFVAKQELFRIPIFGLTMKKAGYISIDRANPREALKAIEEAVARIQGGANILIFPEGTRSCDGKLLPFMKGAFSLAIRAGVPVAPLAIIGTNTLQPSGATVPLHTGTVTLRVGKPIPLEGKGSSYKNELMEEVRGSIERLAQCRMN